MKNVRYSLVLAGLLPGLAIGWVLNDSANGSKQDRASHETHLSRRGDLGKEHDVRNQRARGVRHKSDQEAGKHLSNTPLLDLVSGSVELAAMTEMSSLMSYRLYGEVMNLQRDDFPGMMQRAKIGDSWNGEMLNLLLVRWAEIDPGAALAFGNAHLKGKEIEFLGFDESDWRILITAVDQETNGSGAVTSLESMLAGEDAEEWWSDHDYDMDLFYLYSVKAAKDPESVWQEIFHGENESKDVEMPMVGLIEGCQKSGKMPWLLDKIDSLDEDVRDEMLSNIAMVWTMKDPESAVQWAEQLAKDGNKEVVEEVAEAWSEKSPEQAAEWLLSMSQAGEDSNGSLKNQAFEYMMDADLDSAVSWLESESEDHEKWDDSKVSLVSSLRGKQRYREAFDWVAKIQDEEQRTQAAASMIWHSSSSHHSTEQKNEFEELVENYGFGAEYRRYTELAEERAKASKVTDGIDQKIRGFSWVNGD